MHVADNSVCVAMFYVYIIYSLVSVIIAVLLIQRLVRFSLGDEGVDTVEDALSRIALLVDSYRLSSAKVMLEVRTNKVILRDNQVRLQHGIERPLKLMVQKSLRLLYLSYATDINLNAMQCNANRFRYKRFENAFQKNPK